MFVLVGPPGCNFDYIGNTLTNSNPNEYKKIIYPSTDYISFLKEDNVIQVLSAKKVHYLMINWFSRSGDEKESRYSDSWIREQNSIWKSYFNDEEQRLGRGVLAWYYMLKEKLYEGNKSNHLIKNKFEFDAFYANDVKMLQEEFYKHNIIYTNEMFELWKASQTKAINAYEDIIHNKDNPNNLKTFWQKGIAMGMYGSDNKMPEEQTWEYFNG